MTAFEFGGIALTPSCKPAESSHSTVLGTLPGTETKLRSGFLTHPSGGDVSDERGYDIHHFSHLAPQAEPPAPEEIASLISDCRWSWRRWTR